LEKDKKLVRKHKIAAQEAAKTKEPDESREEDGDKGLLSTLWEKITKFVKKEVKI